MGIGERRPMSCQLEQNRRDSAGERVVVDSDDIELYDVRRARCYTFEPAVHGAFWAAVRKFLREPQAGVCVPRCALASSAILKRGNAERGSILPPC